VKVISIYEAKTQLSKLVDMALAGQEIVISRRKTPLVSLQPLRMSKTARKTGTMTGLVVSMAESFNDSFDNWEEDAAFQDGATPAVKAGRARRK